MGGLSKKAYQLERLRKKGGKPVLAIDGGALLFKRERLAADQLLQDKAAAQGIVKAYNRMDYAAVGVSGYDLAAGLEFLLDLQKKSSFSWLSANLVRKASGRPIFTPSIIEKRGSLRIGLIGLTGPGAANSLSAADDAEVVPWRKSLPNAVKGLKSSCDMIVLLSSLPLAENKKIAAETPAVNLIIQAGTAVANLPPQRGNNALIVQTGKQGKYVGLLDILWQPSKTWGKRNEQLLAQKRNDLDRTGWQLKRYRRKGDPEKILKNEPRKLASYRSLVKRQERLRREITALEEAVRRQKGQAFSTYDNSFLAMTTSLPDQADILGIEQQTTREVNRLGRKLAKERLSRRAGNAALTLSDAAFPFAGWRACAGCHPRQAAAWQKTRHAKAYQTLVQRGQQFNLKCVACHVTGLQSGHEPYALALPSGLQQVGCEVCHGPGKEHSADPGRPMTRRPSETVCLRCHTPEHDDHFDYQKDLQKLGCPSGS